LEIWLCNHGSKLCPPAAAFQENRISCKADHFVPSFMDEFLARKKWKMPKLLIGIQAGTHHVLLCCASSFSLCVSLTRPCLSWIFINA
jgi:hypothetical protein